MWIPPCSRAPQRRSRYVHEPARAVLAHATNSYLNGVSLALQYNLKLIHLPLIAAHGLDTAFDDLLSADPRGLVAPLALPTLGADREGNLVLDGQKIHVRVLSKEMTVSHVHANISSASDGVLIWLRKDFAYATEPYGHGATVRPELVDAGLWLRERFWRSVHAWHGLSAVAQPP